MEAVNKRGRPFAPLTFQSVVAPFTGLPVDQLKGMSTDRLKAIMARFADVSLSARIRLLILAGIDDRSVFLITGQRTAKIAEHRRKLKAALPNEH